MTNETNADTRRSRTDRVKEKVGDATESVRETAAHIAAEAREKGSHLADEGREKAHELGDRARSRADEQKQKVTNGMRTFADVLRRGSDDLSADQNQYRPLLNGAADRVEDVSRYLEQRDVDALTGDVRRFARDHTPLFLTGAFALGFAGARFLKSSSERVERERQSLQYRDRQNQERFDRMLPETGTVDTGALETATRDAGGMETGTQRTTGTSAFDDGGTSEGRPL